MSSIACSDKGHEPTGRRRDQARRPFVRDRLCARYRQLCAQFPDPAAWGDRLAAIEEGDILVEPGWMLRPIVAFDVDIHGLYRVYPDGRVERDRYLERREVERFRAAGDTTEPTS
jgi:hypothetical protein